MGILDRQIYKEIEWHLYHYFDLKREVKEYREKVLNSSTPLFGKVGEGQSYHSDSTAIKALMLAKPPKEIEEYEKWFTIIEKTIQKFKNTDKEKLLQLIYFDEEGREYIQKRLHIERATYFHWKDEIILYIALLAAQENLIKV
ncbi:DUF1492 domain-containing protein [Thermoanaerobacterium sp. R66]|uniref:DUF1492 domain-containing protein n=1 Tax=Thermoanaerobacterium TaxID=28895 RepID=UPI002380551D|nr:DUF1492 domain-containing protein [Thermoanaerobacterium sp. R66]MDE4542275.1 DUF1492 domain-containing protein [Thermoanaerobacterium sp. R66]